MQGISRIPLMESLGFFKKSMPLARSAIVAVSTVLVLFVSCSLLIADQASLRLGSGISLASASTLIQNLFSLGGLEAYAERIQALEMEMRNVSGNVQSLRDNQLAAQLTVATLEQTVLTFKEGALTADTETPQASDSEHSNLDHRSKDPNQRSQKDSELKTGAKRPAEEKLERCSSGTLLGGWQDSTYIPLPLDIMDVFLGEAEGKLNAEQKAGLQYEGNEFESMTDAFPALMHKPIAQTSGVGELTFQPPCFYHTCSREEFVRLFAGKWLYFLGDSNTRALVLGLLTILDPTHNQPFDEQRWFNSSDKVRFPHVEAVDYFLREDGSILSKFGETGGTIPGKNGLPSEPYSVRISFRMQSDARRMLLSLPDTLGHNDWRPDFLYFNTGNWDATEGVHHGVPWSEIEDSYGPLLDKIVTTCKPERQVCVWGTLTSNVHLEQPYHHSRLALAQWRHLAKIALAQPQGRPKSLHVLDRFWASHVSDQGKGGHYGHMVNIWDAQRLINVYHGIVQKTVDLAPPASQQLESGNEKRPECTLKVDGHFATAKCDWFPETVAFGDGCVMERGDPGEGGGVLHMWERNCEAKVRYSTRVPT